jgi:predicted site-specific integrase-resolvase
MKQVPLKQACESIGVPYRSALYYLNKGYLPTEKIGNYNMINPRTLEKILQAMGYRQREKKTIGQVH